MKKTHYERTFYDKLNKIDFDEKLGTTYEPEFNLEDRLRMQAWKKLVEVRARLGRLSLPKSILSDDETLRVVDMSQIDTAYRRGRSYGIYRQQK